MAAGSERRQATTIGARARRRLDGFVRTLRDNGFAAGLGETQDALAILASPAGERRSLLMPALKALFCARRSDWERFDEIFCAYWQGRYVRRMQRATGAPKQDPPSLEHLARRGTAPGQPGASHLFESAEGDSGDGPTARREHASEPSAAERLTLADLRHVVDPEEIAKAHALAERLAHRMRARLVRRERARRRGRRLDLRRTIHRSVSRGGTPVDLAWRQRKSKPLRLIVLLDASGSMAPYMAFFVRFLHAVLGAFCESEGFIFHTSLAHVSASLRERDVARAVDRLSLLARGIGGGTRIGECLATFNRFHAKRVISSRTAIMIVSDGYDTGEPKRLAQEMRALRRRCRRIIWLNPLIGWRGYTPEARGMQAALPYVDLFAPAHNLASLAALDPYLASI